MICKLFFVIYTILSLHLLLVSDVLAQAPKKVVIPKNQLEVKIKVEIIGGKPTGTDKGIVAGKPAMLWDISGVWQKPDIQVCFSEVGVQRRCTQECSDTESCIFEKLAIQTEKLRLEIIDVDLFEHDLIGEGICIVGSTCVIGQARVTIEAACSYGAAVDRSKITKDILIDHPNENISHMLIRHDGFEINLTPKGIILGDKIGGSKQIAREAMGFAEAKMKACFGIDENRLANEIGLHATAFKLNINVKAANPVNVEWADIDYK